MAALEIAETHSFSPFVLLYCCPTQVDLHLQAWTARPAGFDEAFAPPYVPCCPRGHIPRRPCSMSDSSPVYNLKLQTVGTPTVAVSTLVMAGSLVQVPTVAAAKAAAQGGQGGTGTLGHRRWRRFRCIVGLLHVVCRLIVVSERSS